MNVQSNINQMLSVAGMLATMNPELRAKAEKRSEIRGLKKQRKTLTQARDVAVEENKYGLGEEYQKNLIDVNRKLFETDPSEETLKSYTTARKDAGLDQPTPDNPVYDPEFEMQQEALRRYEEQQNEEHIRRMVEGLEKSDPNSTLNIRKRALEAEAKAQEATQAKQEERRKGRRVFKEYLADEPTNLGVSFGELSPNIQNEILKSYSSSERKAIMNRKDAKNE